MTTRQALLLTAVSSFASGFLAGVLLAPYSGREARRRLVQTTQDSTRWAAGRLHDLEARLGTLEQQIHTAGTQLGDKMRETAHKAVDPYLPVLPEEDEAWKVERDELARDLRHLPRR